MILHHRARRQCLLNLAGRRLRKGAKLTSSKPAWAKKQEVKASLRYLDPISKIKSNKNGPPKTYFKYLMVFFLNNKTFECLLLIDQIKNVYFSFLKIYMKEGLTM